MIMPPYFFLAAGFFLATFFLAAGFLVAFLAGCRRERRGEGQTVS